MSLICIFKIFKFVAGYIRLNQILALLEWLADNREQEIKIKDNELW